MSRSVYGEPREPHDQQAILDGILTFVDNFRLTHAYGPSYREIGDGVGLRSKSDVHRYMHLLRRRYLIEWDDGIARSVRVTPLAQA